jgi:hypothetical protein
MNVFQAFDRMTITYKICWAVFGNSICHPGEYFQPVNLRFRQINKFMLLNLVVIHSLNLCPHTVTTLIMNMKNEHTAAKSHLWTTNP